MRPGPATLTGLCGAWCVVRGVWCVVSGPSRTWGDTTVINGKSGSRLGVGGFRKGRYWGQSCECSAGQISRV